MNYMVLGHRVVGTLAAVAVLAACGSDPQPTGNGRPKSPQDLPSVGANLDFTGAVRGHVSDVRFDECRKRPKPDGNFYTSIYFQLKGQWYFLQLIAVTPLPIAGNRSGYSVPGLYEALVDFREMKVYPGGMVNGDHAWGGVTTDTLTIAPDAHLVTLGSATGKTVQSVYTNQMTLWPERTDQLAPPAEPTPNPDQVVTVQGSWHCP